MGWLYHKITPTRRSVIVSLTNPVHFYQWFGVRSGPQLLILLDRLRLDFIYTFYTCYSSLPLIFGR